MAELMRKAALEGVRDESPHSLAVVIDDAILYATCVSRSPRTGSATQNSLAGLGFQGPAKSPTVVILLPSQAMAKPPAVKAQFKMIARCGGLSIHKSSAAVGVAADPVPQ
jgi:hypothetical protein